MSRRFHRFNKHLTYADDAKEGVSLLIRIRLPWLIVGLAVGTLITFLVSRFESVLADEVSLAFFIPIIIYMSDAVGTQTETIYVRNMSVDDKQAKFSKYFFKELILGMTIGAICGFTIGLVAYFWLDSFQVALTVGLAMLASMSAAAVFALVVPSLLHKVASIDPAVGAGPFTTVMQDMISLLIYFLIASAIILH